MLRTISSLRLSPRFSLPCRREQSIGKIPGWTGLQVRQHSFYSRERKTEIFKRITDRDTAKIHRRKVVVESVAIATLLPVVYFRRMRFYRMLISRKNRISLRELARNRGIQNRAVSRSRFLQILPSTSKNSRQTSNASVRCSRIPVAAWINYDTNEQIVLVGEKIVRFVSFYRYWR